MNKNKVQKVELGAVGYRNVEERKALASDYCRHRQELKSPRSFRKVHTGRRYTYE